MISADRSKRGVLFPDTPAFKRQEAYASRFGNLDIVGFSRRSDEVREYEGEQLHIIPTHSMSRFLYVRDAIRIAKKLPKPDVVTVQDPFEAGLAGWRIAKRFGVPLHVQIHTDFLSPEYTKLSLLNRLRVHIAQFVLRRATHIRVVSGRIRDGLETLEHSARVTVLPIFVDVQSFQEAAAFERPYLKYTKTLLVVSRLEKEKNVQLAVDAFVQVAPEDCGLVIVGEGSRWPTVDPAVEARVTIVKDETLPSLYKSVDLVLVPSTYEGYGLVIVEALAAGKPVLSTDVGVAREAGAIVTTQDRFADALAEWFRSGPRTGELKNYQYRSFEEYVGMYCEDIRTCVKGQKSE